MVLLRKSTGNMGEQRGMPGSPAGFKLGTFCPQWKVSVGHKSPAEGDTVK